MQHLSVLSAEGLLPAAPPNQIDPLGEYSLRSHRPMPRVERTVADRRTRSIVRHDYVNARSAVA
jgi:hypothetical protein